MNTIIRLVVVTFLLILYWSTWGISRLFHWRLNQRKSRSGNIMVIGTFHNPNWVMAHITPLKHASIGNLILISDGETPSINNVVYECPPKLLSMIFSRAGAKLIWALICSIKYKPDLYMGYHIIPASIIALFVGRLFGRPVCYQNTSGSVELAGGGWAAANPILKRLMSPSRLVEKAVFFVIREFDIIVVRGTNTIDYLRDSGYHGPIEIITGSVIPSDINIQPKSRSSDLVFVGRLSNTKRPEIFVKITERLIELNPAITSKIIGDGEKFDLIRDLISNSSLHDKLQMLGKRSDVLEQMTDSKLFILTSRSEGMSIALLEAMSCGCVPIVSDVGELSDIIKHGENGFLVPKDDIDQYVEYADLVLKDTDSLNRLSANARNDAIAYSGIDVISNKWKLLMNDYM